MFTGLIEAVGELIAATPTGSGYRLRLVTQLAASLKSGDSIAVNGVCLTITAGNEQSIEADLGPETARVTTLGELRAGTLVNLERPLRADSRLGGHFVQGHVDATGTVASIRPDAECQWVTIAFPSMLAPYFIEKGSVAVDGISLTIATLGRDRFDLQIIPFTWEHTNLRSIRGGDRVNLECDMLGKYVVRVTELMGAAIRHAAAH